MASQYNWAPDAVEAATTQEEVLAAFIDYDANVAAHQEAAHTPDGIQYANQEVINEAIATIERFMDDETSLWDATFKAHSHVAAEHKAEVVDSLGALAETPLSKEELQTLVAGAVDVPRDLQEAATLTLNAMTEHGLQDEPGKAVELALEGLGQHERVSAALEQSEASLDAALHRSGPVLDLNAAEMDTLRSDPNAEVLMERLATDYLYQAEIDKFAEQGTPGEQLVIELYQRDREFAGPDEWDTTESGKHIQSLYEVHLELEQSGAQSEGAVQEQDTSASMPTAEAEADAEMDM